MIEDHELRQLFEAESGEHLAALEEGFLQLEQAPESGELRQQLLREAHSLKGAARMLGLSEIELLSHRLEELLRDDGRTTSPSSLQINPLFTAVDALKALSAEAVDGVPANIQVSTLIKELEPPVNHETEQTVRTDEPTPSSILQSGLEEKPLLSSENTDREKISASDLADSVSTEAEAIARASDYRIETIRIEAAKLDGLMTHVGELLVTRRRFDARLDEVTDLLSHWKGVKRQLQQDGKSDLQLKRTVAAMESIGSGLQRLEGALRSDNARLDMVSERLDDGIRESRMIPLSTLFQQFKRMVRDISAALGKEIRLVVEGGETLADKRIVEEMKDPLMHLLRNAIHHGIEPVDTRETIGNPAVGTIHLRGLLQGSNIVLEVDDDGCGLDLEKIAARAVHLKLYSEEEVRGMSPQKIQSLIFHTGFSTQEVITDISGRGVGMDVVHHNIEAMKGRMKVENRPGSGVCFSCELPQTFATSRVILVRVNERVFGVPIEYVHSSFWVLPEEIYPLEGHPTITSNDEPLSVVTAAELLELELPERRQPTDRLSCIVLWNGESRLGMIVDEIVDEQELVLKPVGAMMKRVRNVSGCGILDTGKVCMILNPQDLIRTLYQRSDAVGKVVVEEGTTSPPVVLLVEDSLVTRAQEKRILEGDGYQVLASVNGAEAWQQLQQRSDIDAVVSDIMMPEMDGFELTESIRADERYRDLPIVLVTTRSADEDRMRGMECGANAYITKAGFKQTELLESLRLLIGRS